VILAGPIPGTIARRSRVSRVVWSVVGMGAGGEVAGELRLNDTAATAGAGRAGGK
jgi:hypothetical protein